MVFIQTKLNMKVNFIFYTRNVFSLTCTKPKQSTIFRSYCSHFNKSENVTPKLIFLLRPMTNIVETWEEYYKPIIESFLQNPDEEQIELLWESLTSLKVRFIEEIYIIEYDKISEFTGKVDQNYIKDTFKTFEKTMFTMLTMLSHYASVFFHEKMKELASETRKKMITTIKEVMDMSYNAMFNVIMKETALIDEYCEKESNIIPNPPDTQHGFATFRRGWETLEEARRLYEDTFNPKPQTSSEIPPTVINTPLKDLLDENIVPGLYFTMTIFFW